METKTFEIGTNAMRVIRIVLGSLFVLTLLSMGIDFYLRGIEKQNAHSQEMSRRGYCLKATAGTDQLTYQPCNVAKE